VFVILMAAASTGDSGPWSQLPDAVDQLRVSPGDEDSERVIRLAEGSLLREAQAGHLAATRALFDIYASLVTQLDDGDDRLVRAERRVAQRLLQLAEMQHGSDVPQAVAAFAMAAELDPESPAVDRMRSLLFPPIVAEPGQLWTSPVDGAELVFHPAMAVRMGCTDGDGACRDNEVIFKWVRVPDVWIEVHEVSNRRYGRCVTAGACSLPEDPSVFNDAARADHPAVGVSWRQAKSFSRWAGRRLPSEAEWERAARGEVANLRFPWGNGRRRGLANVWSGPGSELAGGTREAGSFPATGWGVHDIAGNVWEWCEDRYQKTIPDAVVNGGSSREGWGRVVRGGSWRRSIDMARVSTRSWQDVGYFGDDLGFRGAVSHNLEHSVGELVRLAQRAFPLLVKPGRELDRAQLEDEDRRYLERRAITLMMIEGRMEDALIPAALRLVRERRDPVALDLFNRFENDLLDQIAQSLFSEVERGLNAYRRAAVENSRLVERLQACERRMLEALRRAVSGLESRNERRTALQAAELGHSIAEEDVAFLGAMRRLALRTGSTRIWPKDGKGMVWVGPGSFRMGGSVDDGSANLNEYPARQVETRGYWIDRTEVTNDEYRSCVEASACTPPHRTEFYENPNIGNHPVLWVDWFQARTYAAWAGKRLASGAEWERAARAGTDTAYPWGSSWEDGRANALGTEGSDRWGGAAPVASFDPNPWGVYDLVGNAAEWVDDVYNDNFRGAPRDGRAWHQETGLAGERRRVVRGAGYDDPPGRQRVSRRNGRRPGDFQRMVGFRCVADE
jgi:formylglycine-generating enzyme required for sulfatase activity